MSNENLVPPELPSIPEMLRVTGGNTAQFMEQVALHIEKLENEVVRLRDRVQELEGGNGSATDNS
jgi:hypothetical protein